MDVGGYFRVGKIEMVTVNNTTLSNLQTEPLHGAVVIGEVHL